MSQTIFNLKYPSLSILNSDKTFPVHRIYCVGQNYAAHTVEMGGDPSRDAPFFFSKPADAVSQSKSLPWPPRTQDLHHEVELVVAIGCSGKNFNLKEAEDCIFGYGVGVDLTRRDLQAVAKKSGRPWDTAKGFDHSAPISSLVPVKDWTIEGNKSISLSVNNKVRQQATLEQLIWNIPELISELSSLYTLSEGDLIFTGTPAGVSALTAGDTVQASIEGLPDLRFTMEKP